MICVTYVLHMLSRQVNVLLPLVIKNIQVNISKFYVLSISSLVTCLLYWGTHFLSFHLFREVHIKQF